MRLVSPGTTPSAPVGIPIDSSRGFFASRSIQGKCHWAARIALDTGHPRSQI